MSLAPQTVTYPVDDLEVVKLVAAGQDNVSSVPHGVGQDLREFLRDDTSVSNIGFFEPSKLGIVIVVRVFVHL